MYKYMRVNLLYRFRTYTPGPVERDGTESWGLSQEKRVRTKLDEHLKSTGVTKRPRSTIQTQDRGGDPSHTGIRSVDWRITDSKINVLRRSLRTDLTVSLLVTRLHTFPVPVQSHAPWITLESYRPGVIGNARGFVKSVKDQDS